MDGFHLLTRELSFSNTYNHSSSTLQCHQYYENNSNSQGLQLLCDEPCVNTTFMPRSAQLCPETTSLKEEKEIHLQSYYLYGENNSLNQSSTSSSCRYSTNQDIKINPMYAQSYQSLKLPSNYYHGTYPLTVQSQDDIPNTNIFPESPEFSGIGNVPLLDPCLTIKPSENDSNIKRDLPQQSCESDINNNQALNSNHQVHDSKLNTSHQYKESSVINIKGLSTNTNQPAPIAESSSKEHSLSSGSPKSELNCTDYPTMESESNPDIIIVKDLHHSDYISVKTDGLYSPKKLIRKTRRLNRNLDSFKQRVNKNPLEIQKLELTIQKHSPTYSSMPRLEPHVSRWSDCIFNNSGKHDTLNIYSDSSITKQNLNSSQHERPYKSEDLCKLLNHLPKSNLNGSDCLYNGCSQNVNIFFVPLVCDTIHLVITLAKIHGTEIPNAFGLVLERKFQLPGDSLTIKFWNFHSYNSFTNLRMFGGSTKNVTVLVHDITKNLDVYDVEKEVEFLTLHNMPILLVGNTSNSNNENSSCRKLCNRNELLMKDIRKVSTFLKLSINSTKDIQGLLITAMDLAFPHGV